MLAHLKALEALVPDDYQTFRVYANLTDDGEVPAVPYVVLSAPAWSGTDEVAVSDTGEVLDTDVRFTAVAGTPDGVLIILNRLRSVLSPDSGWRDVAVADRVAQVRYIRSEFVSVDRDVTITGTNRHPAVGVDTYRLVSQPA